MLTALRWEQARLFTSPYSEFKEGAMSSPTITALDYILIMLGIAPLKYIVSWWMAKRAKRREEVLKKLERKRLRRMNKI